MTDMTMKKRIIKKQRRLFTPLPSGPFDVVVADPPWLYQRQPGINGATTKGAPGIAEANYPTLTPDQIATLPVREVLADSAHLFLWFTNPGMFGGRYSQMTPADIAKAWGFNYKTTITWVKTTKEGAPTNGGMGWYFRGCTEHVLYATKGKASIPAALRQPNIIMAPRSRHSAKPDAFFDLVESVTTGRRLELFARQPRNGWTVWGNEV